MLRTRIPTARLVDMVDQAILYLHAQDTAAGANGKPAPTSNMERLSQYGIRTATDLELAYAAADERGQAAEFLGLLDSPRAQC